MAQQINSLELETIQQFNAAFFDDASLAWRLNKKEIKHTGNFVYIKNRCTHIKKDHKQCDNECKPYSNVCKYH